VVLLGAASEYEGLPDVVTRIDPADAPARDSALRSAVAVLVTSSSEDGCEPLAVPHRALEAMAHGSATVVTGAATAFADELHAGEHALVIPGRDPAAVVHALSALLRDTPRREALALAGCAHVRARPNADACAALALEPWRELLRRPVGVRPMPAAG
jgi:glycosyltransferase involved in cell wall biosynthesis